jgi:hypothetical protein
VEGGKEGGQYDSWRKTSEMLQDARRDSSSVRSWRAGKIRKSGSGKGLRSQKCCEADKGQGGIDGDIEPELTSTAALH